MRISIRQLKQIIKEQVEESTKGGRIYDEEEDSGREPSEREAPLRGFGGKLIADDRTIAKLKREILKNIDVDMRGEVELTIDKLIKTVEDMCGPSEDSYLDSGGY